MDDVENLLKGTVAELDRLLNARNVLGEPIQTEGATIIPMVSFGFGFGAGSSTGGKAGPSSGTGAGGGIKPLGAIIIDADGARVEAVRGTVTTIADMVRTTAAEAIAARSAKGEKAGGD